ncbi:hypothetical protein ACHAQA_000908 [Verticillium albo-atrum]
MGKRIIFTGGSGQAGRWAVRELLQEGHQILNLDLAPLDEPGVHTMKCDLTDAGQVFSAFSSHLTLSEPLPEGPPRPPDAVIHFAGIPRPLLAPDTEILRVNVASIQNVLEAACKLGIPKVLLASSITTYGATFADGARPVPYAAFPVEESADCNPTDPYALSKLLGETMARSFAARYSLDVYCLRIGPVITPDDYHRLFPSYVAEPARWAVHGWSYTDARDLGLMCHRGLETDGLGFQVFNATNDDMTNDRRTSDFLRELYPDVPFTRDMGDSEAPVTNRKMKRLLGFEERHSWRKYYSPS